MEYLCAKFGDFGLSGQTDGQTESQMRMNATDSTTVGISSYYLSGVIIVS